TTHQADDLAHAGFHVFRFDMPGLGDSEGHLPDNALAVMRMIQSGGHSMYASELVGSLIEAYHLKRIILAGHCGGAVTAIYTASESHARGVSALIAYEPDFRMQIRSQSEKVRCAAAYQVLRTVILKSWAGPFIHKAFVSVKGIRRVYSRWRMRLPE